MNSEGKILIACIGNLFLGDDGFGWEAARALAASGVPKKAVLVDYGIRGIDLAYALLDPWRAVILVDAIARGGAPGTLYLLEPDAEAAARDTFNPHAMHPAQVLQLARSLGPVTAPVTIVGCEPQDFGAELEGRIGLSPAVAAAIPEAVAMVRRLVRDLAAAGALIGSR